jgi:hypothetical protein
MLEKLPKSPKVCLCIVSKIIFPDCSNTVAVGLEVVVVDVTVVEVLVTSVRGRILSRRPIVSCSEDALPWTHRPIHRFLQMNGLV